jgi:hypothetical protein
MGIVITVILIPIILNLFNKQRNKTKKKFAENILIKKINENLDKIVPEKFKDIRKVSVWAEKHLIFQGSIISIFIPYRIKYDLKESIENFYIQKFKKAKNKSELKRTHVHLIEIKKDLEAFLSAYGDVISKKILREYYIIDFHIQTIDLSFNAKEENDYFSFAESISIVIYCLDNMRNLLLKEHKELDMKEIVNIFNKKPRHNKRLVKCRHPAD